MIFRCCVHTSRFIVNSLNVDFCVACLLTNELTIYFLWTVSLCWGRSVLTEGSFSVGRITSDHLTNNSMCDWLLLIFQDNRSDSRGVPGWEAVDCLVENLVNLNRTITALSTAEIAERVWLYSRINYMDNFPSKYTLEWEQRTPPGPWRASRKRIDSHLVNKQLKPSSDQRFTLQRLATRRF